MLRAIDDVDGQGIYIRKLCDALFDVDPRNEYVAFYRGPAQAGRYADRPNVREVVVPGNGKLLWDQVLVPLAARRENLDVLFHHKFSIPLVPPCPAVVQQRGTEYWTHPEFYVGWSGRMDRLYNRVMIPLYCRRAVRVLTNSDSLGDELVRYAGVPRSKLRTVYASADESFRPITDPAALAGVRARYRLPAEPFLLMVVKGHQILGQAAGKSLTPRKNVAVALEAYGRMRARARRWSRRAAARDPGHRHRGAADAGSDRPAHRARHGTHPGLRGIHRHARPLRPGSRPDLPLALRELRHPDRGGHGVRVPGGDRDDVGLPRGRRRRRPAGGPRRRGRARDAMERVSLDDGLAAELRSRGLRRAADFSWTRSARTLLSELGPRWIAPARARGEVVGVVGETMVVVISLPDATDRRARFTERARGTPLPWSWFDAHRELAPGLTHDPDEAIVAKGRPMYPGELGCYSSHYGAWGCSSDSGAPQMLVLEDDTIVDWGFLEKLVTVDLQAAGVPYLRLYAKRPCAFREVLRDAVEQQRTLIQYLDRPLGTQGYVMTREGARLFVRHCREVRRPLDDELDRSWDHGVACLGIFPFPSSSSPPRPPSAPRGSSDSRFRAGSECGARR